MTRRIAIKIQFKYIQIESQLH